MSPTDKTGAAEGGHRDLRRLLNEWDPIGVADLVRDGHFGIGPPGRPDAMAERLAAWWAADGRAGGSVGA